MPDVSEEIPHIFIISRLQSPYELPRPDENKLIQHGDFTDRVVELIMEDLAAPVKDLIHTSTAYLFL